MMEIWQLKSVGKVTWKVKDETLKYILKGGQIDSIYRTQYHIGITQATAWGNEAWRIGMWYIYIVVFFMLKQ